MLLSKYLESNIEESKKKQRKLILSSLAEKERKVTELLFPDTDTKR